MILRFDENVHCSNAVRSPQRSSFQTARIYFIRVKKLAHFGMTETIPDYIQAQSKDEQKALLRYSKRWLLRHWDQERLKLKQLYYLALIGELNDLPLHLSVANYAVKKRLRQVPH